MGCRESSLKRKVHSNPGILKEGRTNPNSLMSQLSKLEKEEQMRPKVSRRRDIIKIREEINKIEKNKTIAKINETKSWFYEKINKIDNPLAKLIKRKRESTQINIIRNENGKITTDSTEINKIEKNKTIEKINETKSWFFEKINKIYKPLARQKKRECT